MVWNKTSEETILVILKALEEYKKSYAQIAQELKVTECLVGRVCRAHAPVELKKKRMSYACAKSKHGMDNPMYGRTKLKHPRAGDTKRSSGYRTVWAPDWWTGSYISSNRILEHHFVWAEFNNQTFVPKGCVIHHIDMDIDNNSFDNLVLLTVSEHVQLHSAIRKEQRLSREGVQPKQAGSAEHPQG